MDNIIQWYSSLGTIDQVFWGCAIFSSIVFLIQLILTLIGMDSSDVDVDYDGADTMDLGGGMSLFTIRNFINFLLGFGWSGVVFHPYISNVFILSLASAAIGVLFVLMFFLIRKQTKKLEANGAFNINDCTGKTADVYLRIPANRNGKGKIQISIHGSIHEIDAITDGESIPTGHKIKVQDVIDNNMLLVSKFV